VAHEMNTPLGSLHAGHDTFRRALRRLQEILADERVDPDELEEVRRIVRAVDKIATTQDLAFERLTRIVAELRNFGRPDRAEVSVVDLHEGLESTLALLAHELRGRIEVERRYGELPPVECHPHRLNQLFMNLLVNAIHAIEGDGTIIVRTASRGDEVSVAIEDSGVGIPEKDVQRIFEAGFTTKDARKGMGLGLLISRQIAHQHGGRIDVRSRPGEGSTFTVTLPVRPPTPAATGGQGRRMGGGPRSLLPLLVLASLAGGLRAATAQEGNILGSPAEIEHRLKTDSMEVLQHPGSRFQDDRTQRSTVRFSDGVILMVKFAAARPGADMFNNRPRYEVAAYDLQKLFLDPDDYVVPPTVMRCFPRDWYRQEVDPNVEETFRHGDCVLTVLQYWLWNVHVSKPMNEELWKADTVYARHLADFNVFTYLVRHEDSNLGNYMISDLPKSPRVFSVDNGVAFRSEPGNRGEAWRRYRLDRIGSRTVERLRALTEADLEKALSVVAQFEDRDGVLTPMPPGPSLNDGRGVREKDGVVQLGLTRREIHDIAGRLQHLLEDVDKGKIRVF
jgi:two-component sensor histidine kinase